MAIADDIALLQTRRAAILAELAGLTQTTIGGKPNTSGSNTVDHVGHRKSLHEELRGIDETLFLYGGGIAETETYAVD